MKNKINLYQSNIPVLLFKLFLVLCSFYYLSMALSPVIQRDGWYFMYKFGQKWIEEGISFGDLLEKRGLTDHSLPLVKILLYFNLNFFSLDFRMEGLLGFLALVGIVLFGYFIYEKNDCNTKKWISAAWICSGSLVLLSPISPETYYWSLSMFGYTYPLLGIICSFLLWGYLKNKKGSRWFLFPILLILFLCGDTASLIMSSALSGPIILTSTNMSGFWKNRQKIIPLITLFSFSLLYFLIVNFNYLKVSLYNGQNLNEGSLLGNFIKNISDIDTYKFLFIRGVIGSNYSSGLKFINYIEFFTALIIFLLLIYFIFRIIKDRGLHTFRDFALLYLFSHFMFSIFLILIGRSSIDAPRYAPIFQLLPVVLFWTPAFISQSISKRSQVFRAILGLFILVALSINYGYTTYKAFSNLIYTKSWEKRSTEIIAEIFENRYDSKDCSPPGQGICDISIDNQRYILDFLNKWKLNIFNPRLQSIYGIQPFSGGLKANKILDWGPKGFVLGGAIPNINTEGDMGMYFQLSNSFELDEIDLQIGEVVIPTVNNGNGLLTALFDVTSITSSENIMISLIDKKQNLILSVGEFQVLK